MLSANCRTILKKRLPVSGSGLLFEEHETVSLYLHKKSSGSDLGDASTESLFYLPAKPPLPDIDDRIVCENKEYVIRQITECRGVDNVLQAVKCRAAQMKKH